MRPPDAPPPPEATGAGQVDQAGRRAKHNPLAHLTPVLCECQDCRAYRAADRALATGRPVTIPGTRGLVVVPDTLLTELAANGFDLPNTYRMERDDGRVVWLYRDPRAAA